MNAFPIRLPILLSCLLAGAACYRSDLREWEVSIPDAASRVELEALANHLLDDNRKLTDEARAFETVEARMAPPRLFIRYNTRMIARKNIAHLLADKGFAVEGIPGDPQRRATFREQAAGTD